MLHERMLIYQASGCLSLHPLEQLAAHRTSGRGSLMSPSLMNSGKLMGPVLCRSCVGNGRFKEFMITRASSCQAQKTTFHSISFHLLALECVLTCPPTTMFPRIDTDVSLWAEHPTVIYCRYFDQLHVSALTATHCKNKALQPRPRTVLIYGHKQVCRWHFGLYAYLANNIRTVKR